MSELFSAQHFAEWCQSMIGQPYWYGTCVFKCTQSLLTSKTKQYPSHYGSSRTAKYKKDIADKKICADCIGGAKGYAWNNGKKKTEVPDKSADGMFTWAKNKGMENGNMKNLPDEPGIMLHKSGHVGYTIGGGYAVEWRGYSYGCVKTKISSRGWTDWVRLPWIVYGEVKPLELGDRVLSKGCVGNDVKQLQQALLAVGLELPKYGVDGDFGSETEKAVKKFQEWNFLDTNGIVDEPVINLLVAALTVRYQVIIPHLALNEAQSLIAKYPEATMYEERKENELV